MARPLRQHPKKVSQLSVPEVDSVTSFASVSEEAVNQDDSACLCGCGSVLALHNAGNKREHPANKKCGVQGGPKMTSNAQLFFGAGRDRHRGRSRSASAFEPRP